MTAVLATETPGGDPFDGITPGVELGTRLAAVDRAEIQAVLIIVPVLIVAMWGVEIVDRVDLP